MRRRDPNKLDVIVEAAARAFVDRGFLRTKIHQVAEGAGVGPGTIYLYVADKDALFELTLRRALGDPAVGFPDLPFRKSNKSNQIATIERRLDAITDFPQLWIACHRREKPEAPEEEYEGILLELSAWLTRYRDAILLIEKNRWEWPAFPPLLDQIVWTELHRQLAIYLEDRIRSGSLSAPGDPAAVTDAVLTVLRATALERGYGGAGQAVEQGPPAVGLLVRALAPSGDGAPLGA